MERDVGIHDDGLVDAVNRAGGSSVPALLNPAARPAERVLALQRAAGNRATGRMLRRAPTWLGQISKALSGRYLTQVGSEEVWVTSEAEEAEAAQLINDIRAEYGVEVSSLKAVAAVRYRRSDDASAEDLASVTTRAWLLIELRAIKRALSYFAPILGSRRLSSTRGGTQELLSVGKVDVRLPGYGSTYGEYFREEDLLNFAMYEFGETKVDKAYRTLERTMEGTAVHEIAHGLFRYAIPEFIGATDGYWLDENSRSGVAGAEAPPTDYGDTNAREDLSESVTLYFIDPDRLRNGNGAAAGSPGNPCPIRFAVIESLVSQWAPTPPAE